MTFTKVSNDYNPVWKILFQVNIYGPDILKDCKMQEYKCKWHGMWWGGYI